MMVDPLHFLFPTPLEVASTSLSSSFALPELMSDISEFDVSERERALTWGMASSCTSSMVYGG